MAKCGACGKFLSAAEAVNCSKCRCWYHRGCVGVKSAGPITTPWHCPECEKKVVRGDRTETPVRARAPAPTAHEESLVNLMDTSPINSTALDATLELNLDIYRAELSQFKEEFLKVVRNEFQLLRDDLADLRASLNSTNDKLNNLQERVSVLESNNIQPMASTEVKDLITQLRSDINERDQELLANDVQISNIPEVSGENPVHTVTLIASKIGVQLQARDIVSAERVGGRRISATQAVAPVVTRPRFIVVRLARRDLRDELLEAARVRRGMTTAELGLPGTATRFYVNERLTKVNRELFRSAREAGSRLGWQFVWAKRGRILARHKPGDSTCHIRCEADIQRIFGLAPSIGSNNPL